MIDSIGLQRLAQAALKDGTEAEAAPVLAEAAARARTDPLLWQWSALLHRALDQHAAALPAAAEAARLAPQDAKIAHGRAHIALEAGLDATALFEATHALAPMDGDVLLGMVAARLAVGDGERAIAELDNMLAGNPGWIGGHVKLAELRWLLGHRDTAMASFDRALAEHPRDFNLWQALIGTLAGGEQWEAALAAIRRGRAAVGGGLFFDVNEAVALSELGDPGADALFAATGDAQDPTLTVRRIRHLLRTGRVEGAMTLIDYALATDQAPFVWPYASIAWRMAGDPRWQWLEGDPRLVSVIDLTDRLPPLDRLAEVLRSIHRARAQHLNQSVRGGTQTDGPLFSRIEPEIVQLRGAIAHAAAQHIAQLPPPDPRHPTLAPRRDRPVRFSGSWSVRLSGQGHHANHIHPLGWFSSALYVAVPESQEHDGWLTLGEPQKELGIPLDPFRRIEPRPGQLVLFPSTLWHGTVPFADGERLTVAFDVAPPR